MPGSVSAIGAQFSLPGDVSGMSDQQLEDILRQRRSAKKQGLLNQADAEMVTLTVAGDSVPMTVGATLELDVCEQGVKVTAMVETGSQSSIISRSLLN